MKKFLCRKCGRIIEERDVNVIVRLFHPLYSAQMTEKILKFRASIEPEVVVKTKEAA